MFNAFKTVRNSLFVIILITIASSFIYEGAALTGLLLLLWFVFAQYSHVKSAHWDCYPMSFLMLAYLVWLVVVSLVSSAPNLTLLYAWILACLPISYLAWNAQPDAHRIWSLLRLFLLGTGLFLAIWGLWQVLSHQGAGQAVGPLADKNTYAALINLFWFPTVFYFVSTAKQGANRLSILVAGFFVFTLGMALFATESRGGIGTWALLLPVMLWATYRYTASKKLIIAILIVSAASYAVSVGLLGMNVGERTYNLAQDTSTSARLLLWKSSIRMIIDHPLLGTGWGTFVAHYPAYRSPLDSSTGGYFAHNDYLQLGTEGGLFAMLLQLSIMAGALMQLRRSLKLTDKISGLESTALLLGTLALFIHASVNFIFYFAFMNILAGLYIARATQLIEIPRRIALPNIHQQIGMPMKIILGGFIALLFAAPLLFHLAAQACLTGSQPGLKVLRKFDPSITGYDVAKLITAIRPTEASGQMTMLDFGVQSLKNSGGIQISGQNFQEVLINEVLDRYDFVRKNTANSPDFGVAEADTLIKYHDRLPHGIAYAKALTILNSCLQTNPYHADSMIELARLQAAEGHKNDAMETLQRAIHKVLTQFDEQLVQVEILRQLAAPKIIPALDEIEKQLRQVRADSETGRPLMLPKNFSEDIDNQLKHIADSIDRAN